MRMMTRNRTRSTCPCGASLNKRTTSSARCTRRQKAADSYPFKRMARQKLSRCRDLEDDVAFTCKLKQNSKQKQKLPVSSHNNDSGISMMPFDVLVHIICCLCHHELEPLSRVSKKFREAVFEAKTMHFDFTTPSRRRMRHSRNKNILSSSKGISSLQREIAAEMQVGNMEWPVTPRAPKDRKAREGRLSSSEIKDLRVKLFSALRMPELQDEARGEAIHLHFSATNRALFLNDDFVEKQPTQSCTEH